MSLQWPVFWKFPQLLNTPHIFAFTLKWFWIANNELHRVGNRALPRLPMADEASRRCLGQPPTFTHFCDYRNRSQVWSTLKTSCFLTGQMRTDSWWGTWSGAKASHSEDMTLLFWGQQQRLTLSEACQMASEFVSHIHGGGSAMTRPPPHCRKNTLQVHCTVPVWLRRQVPHMQISVCCRATFQPLACVRMPESSCSLEEIKHEWLLNTANTTATCPADRPEAGDCNHRGNRFIPNEESGDVKQCSRWLHHLFGRNQINYKTLYSIIFI